MCLELFSIIVCSFWDKCLRSNLSVSFGGLIALVTEFIFRTIGIVVLFPPFVKVISLFRTLMRTSLSLKKFKPRMQFSTMCSSTWYVIGILIWLLNPLGILYVTNDSISSPVAILNVRSLYPCSSLLSTAPVSTSSWVQ